SPSATARRAASLGLRLRGLPLEHLEHAVGDEEAADDVDRREDDRDERERLLDVRVRRPGDEHRADEDDAVDRVRPRHERRVQHRRDLRDDLDADEHGQDEHRDAVQKSHAHAATGSLSTLPSCVTQVSRVISSSKSSVSSEPPPRRWFRNVQTFREYIWLACSGIALGRLSSPTMVTPSSVTVSPGRVSSQFPPASAARSTITEPARIPRAASAVMRTGAGRPGMSAVVMTASDSATWRAMSSCSRSCWSSESATA